MNIFKSKEYLRSIMFGVEDSLVSTTGLVAGITVGSGDNKKFIILAGIVAITIEAVSMGIGEYLSDEGAEELDKLKRHRDNPTISGILMFISYFISGLIPLIPLWVFETPISLILSVLFALICLFFLGFTKGKVVKVSPIKSGLKIFFLGGLATILGVVVGLAFKI